MIDPAIEPLKKKLHNEEREIEALECKVQQADLRTAYPQEYAEIRSEQEEHRQQALECKAEIDRKIATVQSDDENI
jgi:predicted  nucleic acid-binding Zn-ribbon protein